MLTMNVGFHVVSPNLRLIYPTYLLSLGLMAFLGFPGATVVIMGIIVADFDLTGLANQLPLLGRINLHPK